MWFVDLIEEALISRDVQGPFYVIVKFLLQAVFASMEEDGELKISLNESRGSNCHSPVPQDSTDANDAVNNVDKEVGQEEQDEKQDERGSSHVKLTDASLHAMWPLQHQGVPLNELVLNSYTLSEVLRLHLLSAGGYHDDSERRAIRQQRGGYTDKDNPTVIFKMENTALLDSLRHISLFDMDVKDRISILKTLCSELLTFSMTRDAIKDSKHNWKKANRNYQELVRMQKKKITIKKSDKKEGKDDHPTEEKQEVKTKDTTTQMETEDNAKMETQNNVEDLQQPKEK